MSAYAHASEKDYVSESAIIRCGVGGLRECECVCVDVMSPTLRYTAAIMAVLILMPKMKQR